MLTISISEALQGPAAWAEWQSQDAEAVAVAEAWQQQQLGAVDWGLEGSNSELLQDAWKEAAQDPTMWNSWSAHAGVGADAWAHSEFAKLAASEAAAASLALAASTMFHSRNADFKAVEEGVSKATAANEAAWASPLRVPLPEPLQLEPLSQLELGFELEGLESPTEDTFAEPQKLSMPPGLHASSGPGALLTEASPTALAAGASAPPQKPTAVALAEAMALAPPGMTICPSEVGGRACTKVDWKIEDFSGKLQASMGRPVVSPAFSACGLPNLRLMVFPDARDAVKSARSHERKGLYTAMVKKGPLYGSLKLKADGLERATVMTFSLLVGGVRSGPTTYDFSEQAVLGLEDFGVDWLQQVEKASGTLHVGIEIVEVYQK
jgi:hypothetical protein